MFRAKLKKAGVDDVTGNSNGEATAAAAAQVGIYELDRLASKAIYRGGLPFNVYQSNPDLLRLLKAINPALKYSPPSRARLAGELLEECSDDVMAEVRAIVDAKRWINVITDESGARNRDRVVNISVNTSLG